MPDPRKSGYIPSINVEDLPHAADPTTKKRTDFELPPNPESREPYVMERYRRTPGSIGAAASTAAARTGEAMGTHVADTNRDVAEKGAEMGHDIVYHEGLMDGRRQAERGVPPPAQPAAQPPQEERLKALAQQIIAQRRGTDREVNEKARELGELGGSVMGATDSGSAPRALLTEDVKFTRPQEEPQPELAEDLAWVRPREENRAGATDKGVEQLYGQMMKRNMGTPWPAR